MIRDLTDDELRAASPLKWGMTAEGVIPAWVAEMDFAVAEPVVRAVRDAVDRGAMGYPPFELGGGELGAAYAGFAQRHFGETVDPMQVIPTVDVTAGVRLALDVLSEDKAPLVLPLPAYHPQLGLSEVTGRVQWDLPVTPDGDAYVLDLEHLDRLFADGARTLLLTNPHNPCGHVHTREELETIRDLAHRYDARVVSDEIHAPIVLPGATHIPYLSIEGTAGHAVAVVATSKAFNTAGLKCAQVLTADLSTRDRLISVPMVRNESWASFGVVAAVAAYRDGDEWLASLVARLDELRTLLAELLAEHLPEARMRPLDATYLAWIDLRAYGHDDPATVCIKGGVQPSPGHLYEPGLPGHVRLNIATSRERLTEIVRRMGVALSPSA